MRRSWCSCRARRRRVFCGACLEEACLSTAAQQRCKPDPIGHELAYAPQATLTPLLSAPLPLLQMCRAQDAVEVAAPADEDGKELSFQQRQQ